MKAVQFLASVVVSMALVQGCLDGTEQALIKIQRNVEQLLQEECRSGDIRMQRTRDHLTVVITERLLFDVGSHEIKANGTHVLRQIGTLLKMAPLKEVRVAGHADKGSAGDHFKAYFEKLALSKARAIQTVLVLKENGMDSPVVTIEWYGDIRPIASNETQEGRRMNRRVEIVLYAGT